MFKKEQIISVGLKPKDLCGVPWRVAFALQADGWWLRSAITLCKLNPMPESVRDRPTSATEMMFLMTRSPCYYYDQEAVRESIADSSYDRLLSEHLPVFGGVKAPGYETRRHSGKVWAPSEGGGGIGFKGHSGNRKADGTIYVGRNLRNWWPVVTEPLTDEHYAAFGQKWIEPCIRAGTSQRGCCVKCGAPWKRKLKISYEKNRPSASDDLRSRNDDRLDEARGHGGWQGNNLLRKSETTGWHPTCSCQAETIPATILDPFCGSGTTGIVALKLGYSFIGLELNPTYVKMARRRISEVMPLFTQS